MHPRNAPGNHRLAEVVRSPHNRKGFAESEGSRAEFPIEKFPGAQSSLSCSHTLNVASQSQC